MIHRLMSDLMIVNPARAGMIRAAWVASAALAGKPRASGDDPPIEESLEGVGE